VNLPVFRTVKCTCLSGEFTVNRSDPKALAPTPRWYTLRVRGGPSPQKEEWDKREEIAGEISRAISPLT
jgi:hypothetical protein